MAFRLTAMEDAIIHILAALVVISGICLTVIEIESRWPIEPDDLSDRW